VSPLGRISVTWNRALPSGWKNEHVHAPLPVLTMRRFVPSAFITQTCQLAPNGRVLANAIFVPSSDHAGCRSSTVEPAAAGETRC